jgi:hypothetical protein
VVVGDGVYILDHDGKPMPVHLAADEGGNHMQNWVDAVRERKPEMLHAESLETHLSSGLCHTGLISHRLGKAMAAGEILERIQGNKLALERFELMKDHLMRNGVDLTSTEATLGPWLTYDPKRERFVDNEAANSLSTPPYRQGFEVPKKF